MPALVPALAAMLALATLSYAGPTAAYRTAAELPDFAGTPQVRWTTDFMEYTLNRDLPAGVSYERFASDVESALGTWMKPGCSIFTFRSGGTVITPAKPD